jgi:hypothetical protein
MTVVVLNYIAGRDQQKICGSCRFRLNYEAWMRLHKTERGKAVCLEGNDLSNKREVKIHMTHLKKTE